MSTPCRSTQPKIPTTSFSANPMGRSSTAPSRPGIVHYDRSRGAALVDLNLDGMLDLVEVNRVVNVNVLRNVGAGDDADNPSPMGNWIAIRLEQPSVNPDAIGSWIEVKIGDAWSRMRSPSEEVTPAIRLAGFTSGSALPDEADVRVQWPNGEIGPWMTVDADRFVIIARDADAPTVWVPVGD